MHWPDCSGLVEKQRPGTTILCDACQSMFRIWKHPQKTNIIGTQAEFDAVRWYGKLDYFSINNMRWHHSSPGRMQSAAEDGCQICTILQEHWEQNFDETEKGRIMCFVSVVQQPMLGFIRMQSKPGMRFWWLDFWRNARSFGLWLRYRKTFSLYRVQKLAKHEAATIMFQFGDADDRTVFLELHPHFDWWHTNACNTCDGIAIHELGPSTESSATLAQIKRWYQTCAEGHPNCSLRRSEASEHPTWNPTRLINVGQSEHLDDPFLQLSSEMSSSVSYMTLSHCWGSPDGPRPPKLTESVLHSWRSGVPMEYMPRTFKDAIQIARALDVSYLWIDSLCIIQDSLDDWRRESRLMDKVYRFSACNILAEAALDCDGGLFFDRDPQDLGVFTLDEKQTSSLSHRSNICFIRDYVDTKSRGGKGSPLYSRGWVCQERWLAPRLLSFHSNQVFWECAKVKACEAFPSSGVKAVTDQGNIKLAYRSNIQAIGRGVIHPHISTLEGRDAFSSSWQQIVESYTSCTLTEEQDKLIAIQGIANIHKRTRNDEYLAGLWQASLPSGLMWTTRDGLQASGEPTYRPQVYRAPTWSWASVEGLIEIYPEVHPEEERWVNLCQILEAKTTPLGEGTTGQVSDGYIKLRGRLLRTSSLSFHTSPKGKFVQIVRSLDGDPSKSWINCQIDDVANWSPKDNLLLPALQCEYRSFQSCMLKGLVLEPVEGPADTYKRVGTWSDNANRDGIDPYGWFKEVARQEEQVIILV